MCHSTKPFKQRAPATQRAGAPDLLAAGRGGGRIFPNRRKKTSPEDQQEMFGRWVWPPFVPAGREGRLAVVGFHRSIRCQDQRCWLTSSTGMNLESVMVIADEVDETCTSPAQPLKNVFVVARVSANPCRWCISRKVLVTRGAIDKLEMFA